MQNRFQKQFIDCTEEDVLFTGLNNERFIQGIDDLHAIRESLDAALVHALCAPKDGNDLRRMRALGGVQ